MRGAFMALLALGFVVGAAPAAEAHAGFCNLQPIVGPDQLVGCVVDCVVNHVLTAAPHDCEFVH